MKQDNTFKGSGQIYRPDGTTFLCFCDYDLIVETDDQGGQNIRGYLSGINFEQMSEMQGQPWILQMQEGKNVEIHAADVMSDKKIEIRANS